MKWKTLQHNGILFPPKYEVRGFSIKISGKKVPLSPAQEEMAYQWAKKKDTPYAQDAVFQRNFTADFAAALGSKFSRIKYTDIDFVEAYRIVDKEKDRKELMSKEEKKELAAGRKKEREKMKEKYGTAQLDGEQVEVANYMAEPPGIFIGRGEHPLRGKWKGRVEHKDVTLNLGKDAKIPPGKWGKIVHDGDTMWLASWIDGLTKKRKYVWLADTAGLKQERDRAKYDKAMKLASEIDKIMARIAADMKDADPEKSKIATVCYLIYRTAMRVGDEKDADEADTVGATTLRKEHVKITDNAIKFDFLGKDSVRWKETIPAVGIDLQFRDNLKRIIEHSNTKEIFDKISSRHVNAYYSGVVKGLTAKVFRTYLASSKVTEYLRERGNIKSDSDHEKLYHAKLANLQAAIMCNHKRTIPKTFEQSLQKKRDKLAEAKKKMPAQKAAEALKKAESASPKTKAQKSNKKKRIKRLREQIKKQKERHADRLEKATLQIELVEKTRDYNIGTSLRNYIDPRVFKSWTDEMGAQWEKLYTTALQRKFTWVRAEDEKWASISGKY